MKKTLFTGSGVAIITPMHPDGSVHYETLGELIDFQLSGGTDAIIAAGTTGEGSTLSEEEKMEVIRYTVERVKGRVPVIAGTGSNDTAHAVAMSRRAERLGADGLLHITPYYNKASQEGLYRHFSAIAQAVDLPIILYNVPSRTGVNISVDTYRRLSQLQNIVAVKEASGNFSQIIRTVAACQDELAIYIGNDDQITAALSLGAKGVISVLANVAPAQTHDICQSYFDGSPDESARLQARYIDLIDALFEDVNPIPVKEALRWMGFDVGACRLPLCEMEEGKRNKLYRALERHGLSRKNKAESAPR